VRASSRLVRLEHHGVVLAESDRPQLLFEAAFPMARYYLPRHDIRVDLEPSALVTVCAYKGRATHYTVVAAGQELTDIAWSYEDPLLDATGVKGLSRSIRSGWTCSSTGGRSSGRARPGRSDRGSTCGNAARRTIRQAACRAVPFR
jgi:uncharacterized protein (DUF427 family)